MKTILNLLFPRRAPIYGPRIFLQRTWLEKQVDEAIYRRSFKLE